MATVYIERQLREDEAEGTLHRVHLDVHDARHEAGSLKDLDTGVDVLPAAGGQKHLYLVRASVGGALNLEIYGDFVQRVRDVLVCLYIDLGLEGVIAKAPRHIDDLGNDRGTGHRDSDVFELGLGARDDVDHRAGDCVDIGDVLFDHGVRRHGLHAVALNSEPVTAATQFEEFHGGRTYVDTQNRRSLALEEP